MPKCIKCGVLFDRLLNGEYEGDAQNTCDKCLHHDKVEEHVTQIFGILSEEYDLTTGDIAPEQQMEYDKAVQIIANITWAWIQQNE